MTDLDLNCKSDLVTSLTPSTQKQSSRSRVEHQMSCWINGLEQIARSHQKCVKINITF